MTSNENNIASEPSVAFGTYSYSDVMDYLHSIRITPEVKESVARRLLVEVADPYLSKAYTKIDELSLLAKDWDGMGAKMISRRVIDNLKKVLSISSNIDWESWMMSPDTNGAVGLQSKSGMSSISVGDKEFSYYHETECGEEWEDHVEFSPEKLLAVMRKIS